MNTNVSIILVGLNRIDKIHFISGDFFLNLVDDLCAADICRFQMVLFYVDKA